MSFGSLFPCQNDVVFSAIHSAVHRHTECVRVCVCVMNERVQTRINMPINQNYETKCSFVNLRNKKNISPAEHNHRFFQHRARARDDHPKYFENPTIATVFQFPGERNEINKKKKERKRAR